MTALQIALKVLNQMGENEIKTLSRLQNSCFDLVQSWDKADNAARILECIIMLDKRFILIEQGWHRLTDWVIAWRGIETQLILAYLLGVV